MFKKLQFLVVYHFLKTWTVDLRQNLWSNVRNLLVNYLSSNKTNLQTFRMFPKQQGFRFLLLWSSSRGKMPEEESMYQCIPKSLEADCMQALWTQEPNKSLGKKSVITFMEQFESRAMFKALQSLTCEASHPSIYCLLEHIENSSCYLRPRRKKDVNFSIIKTKLCLYYRKTKLFPYQISAMWTREFNKIEALFEKFQYFLI